MNYIKVILFILFGYGKINMNDGVVQQPPSTKEPTITIDSEYVCPNDRISRKKARQVKHKDQCKKGRRYIG